MFFAIFSGLLCLIGFVPTALASTLYWSHYAEDRTQRTNGPYGGYFDIGNTATAWYGAYPAPNLASLRLKLYCDSPNCLAATWKVVFARVDSGVQTTHDSAAVYVPPSPVPIEFSFPDTPSLLFESASTGTRWFSVACASNCNVGWSDWPVAYGSFVLGDVPGFTFRDQFSYYGAPWFEVYAASPAPTLSGLGQFKEDGTTAIPEGGTDTDTGAVFKATVASDSASTVRLQVELRPYGSSFNDAETSYLHDSAFVASDSVATVSSPVLPDDQYKWRTRAVDDHGNASPWQEYGTAGNVDFTVNTSIRVAVIFADMPGDPNSTADDVMHDSATTFAQPCKLDKIERPTHVGHTRAYYLDLLHCVKDYYEEISYGKVKFDFVPFDSSEQWYDLAAPESSYTNDNADLLARDAIAQVGGLDPSYRIAMTVHAGSSFDVTEDPSHVKTLALTFEQDGIQKIVIAENDPLGAWVHELGHVVGYLSDRGMTTPDLYGSVGNVGKWDVMARGGFNGGPGDIGQERGDGSDPSTMSVFSRQFMGWLNETVAYSAASHPHDVPVTSLESTGPGDEIVRYNLSDTTSVDPQVASKYYLIEGRTKNLSTWSSSLPTDNTNNLVLYYVNTGGHSEYGYTTRSSNNVTHIIPDIAKWHIGIPGVVQHGVLDPDINQSFWDYFHGVRFTAHDAQVFNGKHETLVDIDPIGPADYLRVMLGGYMEPRGRLDDSLASGIEQTGLATPPGASSPPTRLATYENFPPSPITYFRGLRLLSVVSLLLLVSASLGIFFFGKARPSPRRTKVTDIALHITLTLSVLSVIALVITAILVEKENAYYRSTGLTPPASTWIFGKYVKFLNAPDLTTDLDLHVYCPDGRHVGVNYATGQYEVQIADAIASGDNQGMPEWILFPPTSENAGCKHVVSAHDNAQFLAQNPDIASQLADASDSYDVYARYIDPATGIFTSTTLADQVIQPGAEIVHAVSGTTDVGIGAGIVDTTAPTTTATLSGASGANGWYVSPVTVSLSADDGADGTGVSGIRYSVDGGLTWLDYTAPFTLSDDGTHFVLFGATDHAGNAEATKSLEARIDQAAPDTVLDSAPSGSTGSTSATFAFYSTEENSIFECNLDSGAWTACTSPTAYTGLAVGTHAFEVRATDQAGNVDETPASANWAILATGTVSVTFDRHTVQSGTQPGSTKSPIAGASVNAYTKASGSCAANIGFNPHDDGTVLSTCTPDASATTDANGLARITVLPGDYLILSRDPQTNVVAGVSSGPVAAAETVDKFLQVIVRANGTSVPGKTTTRTGSLLYIIEPEYVEWSQTQELYPFVFDAPSGDWGITVTVTPPEGFTADYPELSTDVNEDYKALQFTLTDVGSCWTCGTGVELTIRHKGRTEHIRHAIPTPLSREFARKKGLDTEGHAKKDPGISEATPLPSGIRSLLGSFLDWLGGFRLTLADDLWGKGRETLVT